jgi:NACalpha-BTF3-like transcription factor
MSTENTQQQRQNAAAARTDKADARQFEGELSDDDLSLASGGTNNQATKDAIKKLLELNSQSADAVHSLGR